MEKKSFSPPKLKRNKSKAPWAFPLPKRKINPPLLAQIKLAWKVHCPSHKPMCKMKKKLSEKMIVDSFPQWVFSRAKIAELRHRQSGPDLAPHPILDVGYPESPFRARMS